MNLYDLLKNSIHFALEIIFFVLLGCQESNFGF